MSIMWKQKLTSRKLWAAVAAFLVTILTVIFKNQLTSEEVELITKGIIALCVYIFGESGVDIARALISAGIKAESPDINKSGNNNGEE
ncbi:hypothetical protein SDC9_185138 [bioreactor metagenome]|uniref:Holin n=1 Tax=bioreactor metagenome TaxID=1076179 RepID=A0A645HF00_9ZZZZ|nr:hypothetical protein [Oscillospiraceae bacterium]